MEGVRVIRKNCYSCRGVVELVGAELSASGRLVLIEVKCTECPARETLTVAVYPKEGEQNV